jgi:hypothetical protein
MFLIKETIPIISIIFAKLFPIFSTFSKPWPKNQQQQQTNRKKKQKLQKTTTITIRKDIR